MGRRVRPVRADPRQRARYRRAGQGQSVRGDPVGGDAAAPFARHARARRSDRRGGGGGDRRWRADARSRRYALDHGGGRCGACRARMTAERIELAVVIPTFNEDANVAALVARLDTALAGRIWEAIVVDDNSPDGTADAAREIARNDRRVRVIQRIGRRGLPTACIEGMFATATPLVQ